mmetsp:Transcript_22675/g.61390  ORF Transcript_22675/g.61390 Transcript_22675/m.61390 type:complete len:390 (+) Transcript_22675:240-1409(+)
MSTTSNAQNELAVNVSSLAVALHGALEAGDTAEPAVVACTEAQAGTNARAQTRNVSAAWGLDPQTPTNDAVDRARGLLKVGYSLRRVSDSAEPPRALDYLTVTQLMSVKNEIFPPKPPSNKKAKMQGEAELAVRTVLEEQAGVHSGQAALAQTAADYLGAHIRELVGKHHASYPALVQLGKNLEGALVAFDKGELSKAKNRIRNAKPKLSVYDSLNQLEAAKALFKPSFTLEAFTRALSTAVAAGGASPAPVATALACPATDPASLATPSAATALVPSSHGAPGPSSAGGSVSGGSTSTTPLSAISRKRPMTRRQLSEMAVSVPIDQYTDILDAKREPADKDAQLAQLRSLHCPFDCVCSTSESPSMMHHLGPLLRHLSNDADGARRAP